MTRFTTGIVLSSCLFAGVITVAGVQANAFGIWEQESSTSALTVRSLTAEADTAAELKIQQVQLLNNFIASLDSATAHVVDAGVSNDTLVGLRGEVASEVVKQRGLVSNSVDNVLRFPGVVLTISDMEAYISEHSVRVKELLASYDAEVAAETQRIAEAQAALEASQSRDAYRGRESQEARLQRIAAEVGMTVPVSIAEGCGELAGNILGCYSNGAVTVTQLALSRGDNSLRCVLLHENRHAWQHASGFLEFLPGETEADWRARAEADADQNGCR